MGGHIAPEPRVLLLVEDDADCCLALTGVLEEEGFRVESAKNGAVAVQKLESGLRPAAILLDLMMPVMSGWQLWDWLQQQRAFRDLPVVIITATGLRNGSMGKTPVIEKPVDARELVSTVTQVAGAA